LFADSAQRKIFYSPDVVAEYGEDMIFFGTGDRADPNDTDVVNRIYAIRNDWEDASTFTTLTESDLVDVTDNLIQTGTDEEKEAVMTELESKRGWYFNLEESGEKIITSVLVYNGVLYFTTYTPESDATNTSTDLCTTISGRGVARLYAVDYETGAAVKDFDEDGTKERSTIVGASIASSPVIAVRESGAVIYLGTEEGIETVDPVESITMQRFYWRQSF
jgi:type IV pilus assembly protein PilY1